MGLLALSANDGECIYLTFQGPDGPVTARMWVRSKGQGVRHKIVIDAPPSVQVQRQAVRDRQLPQPAADTRVIPHEELMRAIEETMGG